GAARAGQYAALGQDAEAALVGHGREAEQLAVELGPVLGALVADVLHDAEPVQPGDRRRLAIDGGDGHEVDVVDRKLLPTVDEVQATRADAVDAGDVQLHRLDLHRHAPRTALDRALVCRARVAHAQRDGGDGRRRRRAGPRRGMRV